MLKSTLYNAVMSHVGKRDKDTLRIQMQEKRQVNEVFFKDLDELVNPKRGYLAFGLGFDSDQ